MKVHFELQVKRGLYLNNMNKIQMYVASLGVHPQYEI
jgi:hypothetical protein